MTKINASFTHNPQDGDLESSLKSWVNDIEKNYKGSMRYKTNGLKASVFVEVPDNVNASELVNKIAHLKDVDMSID